MCSKIHTADLTCIVSTAGLNTTTRRSRRGLHPRGGAARPTADRAPRVILLGGARGATRMSDEAETALVAVPAVDSVVADDADGEHTSKVSAVEEGEGSAPVVPSEDTDGVDDCAGITARGTSQDADEAGSADASNAGPSSAPLAAHDELDEDIERMFAEVDKLKPTVEPQGIRSDHEALPAPGTDSSPKQGGGGPGLQAAELRKRHSVGSPGVGAPDDASASRSMPDSGDRSPVARRADGLSPQDVQMALFHVDQLFAADSVSPRPPTSARRPRHPHVRPAPLRAPPRAPRLTAPCVPLAAAPVRATSGGGERDGTLELEHRLRRLPRARGEARLHSER